MFSGDFLTRKSNNWKPLISNQTNGSLASQNWHRRPILNPLWPQIRSFIFKGISLNKDTLDKDYRLIVSLFSAKRWDHRKLPVIYRQEVSEREQILHQYLIFSLN